MARWVPRARRGRAHGSVTSVTHLPVVRPEDMQSARESPLTSAARRDADGAPTGGEEAVDAGPVRPQHPLAGIDVEAPHVTHGAGSSSLSRWHGSAAYGPGPNGRNGSAGLPMGSGCPLRAQRSYSSTVDSSADAGTPILSARTRTDGASLRLTNRMHFTPARRRSSH